MKKEVERLYYYCEPCGFKRIVEGKDDSMVEIKTAPVPLGIPTKNPNKYIKKEVKEKDSFGNESVRTFYIPKTKPQNKKVKCPKCGRGITAKQLGGAFVKAYEDADKRKKTQQELDNKKNRMLDGMPKKRRTEFEKEFDKMVGRYLPDKQASKDNLNEFEKVIDSLMEGREKHEQERQEKESHNPRHQTGPSGREVSEETPEGT